jgi:cytochrome c peroxidase
MRKATTTLILFVGCALMLWSCNKESARTAAAPNLPATPYNYTKEMEVTTTTLISGNIHPTVLAWTGHAWIPKSGTGTQTVVSNTIITLGRVIFFDPITGLRNAQNCVVCHAAEAPLAPGNISAQNNIQIQQMQGNNIGNRQAADHSAMGMEAADNMIAKMNRTTYYSQLFRDAFGSAEITEDRISQALGQYMTAISAHSGENLSSDPRFSNPFK